MKKSKFKKVTALGSTSKLRIFSVLAVVVLVASAGFYTLMSSFAETGTSTISIILKDKATGQPIPAGEGYVSISITSSGTLCSNMDGLTNADGQVNFNGCYAGAIYKITFINFKQGWYQVAPGSRPTNGDTVSAPFGTQTSIYFVSTVPTDSDSDGVPNKTDNCVNTAGPASNKGCAVPVVTPTPTPTPAPAPTPTKPPTTSTPKPSSSSAKKTTPSPAKATAPAVVVATTGDTSPPSAPQNFTISQDAGSLFLTWDDASDNIGVTGYNIDRSTDGENWTNIATNMSDSFYTDEDLGSVDHYYYRVQAVDSAGNLSQGILGDIQLVSNKSTSKPKTVTQAAKKSSGGLVVGITIAVLLILGAMIGAFLFFRRKMQGESADPYSYDVSSMPSQNLPTTTVMPTSSPLPLQQPAAHQPLYNVGPPAQHTSVSLKDMVMEEMNRHDQNHQGQPPMPPQPPQPPQQPQ